MQLNARIASVPNPEATISKGFSLMGKVNLIPNQSDNGGNIPGIACLSTTIPGIKAVSGDAGHCEYTLWNSWQEAYDDANTTASYVVNPTASCLLVVAVMHRDEVSIEGDEWTRIVTSQTAVDGDVNQYITVWTKKVEKGKYTVTVNQASSNNISLKVFAFYGAESVDVVDNDLFDSGRFTPTEATGNRRLYLISSIRASTSTNAITVIDSAGIDLRKAEETRFSAFYDYESSRKATPTFGYYDESNIVANSINIITLDIREG